MVPIEPNQQSAITKTPPTALHCTGENWMLSKFSNVVKMYKENEIPITKNYNWSELSDVRIYKQLREFGNWNSQ